MSKAWEILAEGVEDRPCERLGCNTNNIRVSIEHPFKRDGVLLVCLPCRSAHHKWRDMNKAGTSETEKHRSVMV